MTSLKSQVEKYWADKRDLEEQRRAKQARIDKAWGTFKAILVEAGGMPPGLDREGYKFHVVERNRYSFHVPSLAGGHYTLTLWEHPTSGSVSVEPSCYTEMLAAALEADLAPEKLELKLLTTNPE